MKNILILGGGFGGIQAAQTLAKKGRDMRITVVERNNYHLFTPSLYELALADDVQDSLFLQDLRKTVAIPYDLLLRDKKIELIQAEISNIDLENKKILTHGGHVLNYDELIVAIGGESNDFGIMGVSDYAFKFKTLEDGLGVYRRLEEIFKGYSEIKKESPIHIAVVGGGFTGVELSAEIQVVARKLIKRLGIPSQCFKTTIYEAAPKIVPFASDSESDQINRRLKELNIEVVVNAKITEIGPDWIASDGNKFHSDLVVWTAGTRINKLLTNMNLPINEKGRVVVDEYLRVKDIESVYVIGDAAASFCPKTKEPMPLMAYIANAQGEYVANSIIKNKKNLKPFDMGHDTWIAPVGGKYAVVHIGGYHLRVSGFIGWVLRDLVDFYYFSRVMPLRYAIKLFINRARIFSRT